MTRKTLSDWLARADALGAEGRYFEAHEELELPWKTAQGETKLALQGLIQIAAGLHRLRGDARNTAGAFYLLDRGLDKLRQARTLLTADSVSSLEEALQGVKKSGEAPNSLRFGVKACGSTR